MSHRIALIISYDGSRYHGFQFQNESLPTIQLALERAIAQVADHKVRIVCAGRTDTGVHATFQVIHFDTTAVRHLAAWVNGTNRYLAHDIAVLWSGEVSESFSARFSAISRRYLYLIFNSRLRSPLLDDKLAWYPAPLDVGLMQQAANSLVGEHDFSSFRAANCNARTPYRNVHGIVVRRSEDVVIIDITANAFLHHMVRNIAGVLVEVGVGRKEVSWVTDLLAAKDRNKAARTAPASGLYLVDVTYPEGAGIPGGPNLPHLYSSLAS